MHWVTKVFAVLTALLAVGVAALTIAYTANAEQIRAEYSEEVQRRQAAEDTARNAATKAAAEQQRLTNDIESLNNSIGELETQIASMQRERTQLLRDLESARADSLSVQAQLDQLSATNETLSTIVSRYRDEVTALREEELRSAQREIELSDRTSELSGQLEVAIENNRALQEQLVELRDQLNTARAGGGAVASADGGTVRASVPVRARVTGVRTGPSGETLVQIDAGTSDRLRERMELSLVRGDRFLGKVIVTNVDIEESVGRVDYLGLEPVAVVQGDMVMSLAQ